MRNYQNKRGFTLIELLIVIGIIAILVAVIFVILNPLELFSRSRNAQRWVKISELLTAINVYAVHHDGTVPNSADWTEDKNFVLGTGTGCNTTCSATTTEFNCLELSDLVDDKRISSIPLDPRYGTDSNTDFWVRRASGTIVTVGVCDPELEENIELTR
ncbi:MAG: type II secretion system protein [Patescibacteria group bacterium]|nr:type II secretion system protein [Patescibacteria group bacterium]MDD4610991.1 type II secretion system protein [Patescibacteria group bacterium]